MRPLDGTQGMRIAVFAAALCAAAGAVAQSDTVAVAARVCIGGDFIDKERLAQALLDANPIPPTVEQKLGIAGKSAREKLHLLQPMALNCAQCDAAEIAALQPLATRLNAILRPQRVSSENRATFFSADSKFELPCDNTRVLIYLRKPAEEDQAVPRLRIRGTAKDLHISQIDSAFADSTAASFTFQRDRINDIDTHEIQAYMGYEWPVELPGAASIVPYLGLQKAKIEEKGVLVSEDSTEQRVAGISADIFFRGSTDSNIGGLRNGYQFIGLVEARNDHVDKTRQRSATLMFKPYLWHLNRTPFPFNNRYVYVRPMLTLLFNAVNFSHRSTNPELAEKQVNMRRAGTEAGFAIASRDERYRYSYRYTKLNDSKDEGDVSHATQAIEIGLDRQGYAAVALRYEHGTPDDTLKPEKLLSLLLTVRY